MSAPGRPMTPAVETVTEKGRQHNDPAIKDTRRSQAVVTSVEPTCAPPIAACGARL